jgi:organic hydroperoxide reductase OsmC/OhrA
MTKADNLSFPTVYGSRGLRQSYPEEILVRAKGLRSCFSMKLEYFCGTAPIFKLQNSY